MSNLSNENLVSTQDADKCGKNAAENNTKAMALPIALSVVFALAIWTFLSYGLPMIANSFYYKPTNDQMVSEEAGSIVAGADGSFYYDMESFMLVHSPYYQYQGQNIESIGFGKYAVDAYARNLDSLQSNEEVLSFNINKGLIERNKNYSIGDIGNANFTNYFFDFRKTAEQKKWSLNEFKETAKGLPSSSIISTFLEIDAPITLDEYFKLFDSIKSSVSVEYLFVNNFGDQEALGGKHRIYFGMKPSGVKLADMNTEFLEKYPMFNGMNENGVPGDEFYTSFFLSRLSYLADRTEFVNMLNLDSTYNFSTEYYKNSIKYIEENGIQIYGFYVVGEAEEILKLAENLSAVDAIITNAALMYRW